MGVSSLLWKLRMTISKFLEVTPLTRSLAFPCDLSDFLRDICRQTGHARRNKRYHNYIDTDNKTRKNTYFIPTLGMGHVVGKLLTYPCIYIHKTHIDIYIYKHTYLYIIQIYNIKHIIHILLYVNPHSTGQTNQLDSPEDIAAEISSAASNHQGKGQSTEHPPPPPQ